MSAWSSRGLSTRTIIVFDLSAMRGDACVYMTYHKTLRTSLAAIKTVRRGYNANRSIRPTRCFLNRPFQCHGARQATYLMKKTKANVMRWARLVFCPSTSCLWKGLGLDPDVCVCGGVFQSPIPTANPNRTMSNLTMYKNIENAVDHCGHIVVIQQ